MKIFVTGISGHIGSFLADYLRAQTGVELTGMARQADGPGADLLIADLNEDDKIAGFLAKNKPDAVIHLAGITDTNHPQIFEVNHLASEKLAAACAANGVKKFVFASTAAVYGDQGKAPYQEDGPTPGASNYAQSKLLAEKALLEVGESSPMEIIIARMFNVYGPKFDFSLVNRLLASAQSDTSPVKLLDSENFVRDYIHVSHVCECLWKLLSTSGSHTVNVANGQPWSNKKLLQYLTAQGVNCAADIEPSDIYSYSVANITKLQELTQYSPRAELDLRL